MQSEKVPPAVSISMTFLLLAELEQHLCGYLLYFSLPFSILCFPLNVKCDLNELQLDSAIYRESHYSVELCTESPLLLLHSCNLLFILKMDIYIVNNKVNQAKIAQRLESECDYLIIVPNARQNNYSIAAAAAQQQ